MPQIRQKETPIEVFESDDKLLTIRLKRKDSQGVLTPYVLTGAEEITFTVRPDYADTGPALFTYTLSGAGAIDIVDDGSGAGAEASIVSIQFTGTDIATSATYRYALRVRNSLGKNETVAYGPLIVRES